MTSNRDVKSMQNLDLWLDFVDTREIIPLFERNARECTVPTMVGVDWSVEPEYMVQLVKNNIYVYTQKSRVREAVHSRYDLVTRPRRERADPPILQVPYSATLGGQPGRTDD